LKFILFMIGGNIMYLGSFNAFRKVTWWVHVSIDASVMIQAQQRLHYRSLKYYIPLFMAPCLPLYQYSRVKTFC